MEVGSPLAEGVFLTDGAVNLALLHGDRPGTS